VSSSAFVLARTDQAIEWCAGNPILTIPGSAVSTRLAAASRMLRPRCTVG
jgi:hypothetical protein